MTTDDMLLIPALLVDCLSFQVCAMMSQNESKMPCDAGRD